MRNRTKLESGRRVRVDKQMVNMIGDIWGRLSCSSRETVARLIGVQPTYLSHLIGWRLRTVPRSVADNINRVYRETIDNDRAQENGNPQANTEEEGGNNGNGVV